MKHRILPLLCSALMLIAVAFAFTACNKDEPEPEPTPSPPPSEDDGNGGNGEKNENTFLYSEIKSNGEVIGYAVAGFDDFYDAEVKIPASYNEKPVTQIADRAFYENEEIESVRIPASVTAVGKSAFYNCGALVSVSMANGVTEIGELAFADCLSLETVNFGSHLEAVGDYAFSQCYALKEADLPASVKTIGECAFVECVSLEKVVLRDGLLSIGDCAFGGCRRLSSFKMPNSVETIGWGVLMFDVGAVGFAPGDSTNCLTELSLSEKITEIPDYAFSKCNISSLILGGNVTKICYSSFYGCGLMESVVIPKSVKTIESYAFYRCEALTAVFYGGTQQEWNAIKIGKNGNDVNTAEKYFYSENKPDGEGNFWRYVNGVPTVWKN